MPDASPQDARYLVTARKYRPQTFGDLVAQEHVAETLRNAITSGRLAHAYLFSGPRGVGKTTAARILAKAVNCQTPLADREGAEPCRTCDSCQAFEAGRSMNIIEIDAASNNRVEDIRELRDTVRVPPQGATKKVYILDEVHMLSASAFNALLKTLEEPPPYVLFIFATTEPHKVLPTILSRTQRFDFRRIAVPEIVGRLEAICAEEGVTADDESLVLIARKGDGALRDALSLFDQAVSLCGSDLRAPALREALGVVDTDLYFATTDRAQTGDRPGLLALVDGLVARGYDLNEFVLGLADHLRNLLVARSTGTGDLIEGTLATKERYLDAAAPYAEADLLHLLMLTEETATALRESRQPRLTLELALFKMASLERAADLERLLARLEHLQQAVDQGTLTAPAPPAAPEAAPDAAPAASPRPSPQTAEPPTPYASPEPSSNPSQASADAAPLSAPQGAEGSTDEAGSALSLDPEDSPASEPVSSDPPDDSEGGLPVSSTPDRPTPAPTGAPAPSAVPSARSSLFGTPALRRPADASGDGAPGADAALTLSGTGDGSATTTPHLAPADPLGAALADVREAWPKLIEAVRLEGQVRLAAVIGSGTPHRVVRGAVEVAMPDDFSRHVAEGEAGALMQRLARLIDGDAPALRFSVAPQAAPETARAADPFERLKQLRQEHPTVRALFDRFGAEIVW